MMCYPTTLVETLTLAPVRGQQEKLGQVIRAQIPVDHQVAIPHVVIDVHETGGLQGCDHHRVGQSLLEFTARATPGGAHVDENDLPMGSCGIGLALELVGDGATRSCDLDHGDAHVSAFGDGIEGGGGRLHDRG